MSEAQIADWADPTHSYGQENVFNWNSAGLECILEERHVAVGFYGQTLTQFQAQDELLTRRKGRRPRQPASPV